MRLRSAVPFLALAALAGFAPRAHAGLHAGDPAYAWTKTEFGTLATHSQSDYAGKVVLLVMLGYG